MIGLILAISFGIVECIIIEIMSDHLVKHLNEIEEENE